MKSQHNYARWIFQAKRLTYISHSWIFLADVRCWVYARTPFPWPEERQLNRFHMLWS